MSNILRRIIILLLLFVMGCTQVSVTLNGKVTGYYAEAVTRYDTYNGYLIDGKALFQWRTDWSSTNTSKTPQKAPECEYGVFDTYKKVTRQNCDRRYYLTVTYNNNERFCAVDKVAWLRTQVGAYVPVNLTPMGVIECNPT